MNEWKPRSRFHNYRVAWKIVTDEAKSRKSMRPFRLLWKKVTYGDRQPYIVRTTLPEYINFCRINHIAVCIPEKELA